MTLNLVRKIEKKSHVLNFWYVKILYKLKFYVLKFQNLVSKAVDGLIFCALCAMR